MTFSGRTRLLTFGLSAALAVGLVGAGVAFAQDGGDSPPSSTQGESNGRGHHRVLKGILHSIHEHAGLPAGTFKEGFQAGKSINQILAENGVDSAEVQAAVLADLDTKLDELVASGELDAARAAEIYSAAEERLPQLMDRVPDPDRQGRKAGARILKGIKSLFGSAAEALGMEPREFASRLKGGETPAQMAAEQGITTDALVDAILADASARLEAAVAAGTIDTATAAEIESKLEARIETFVTEGAQRNR